MANKTSPLLDIQFRHSHWRRIPRLKLRLEEAAEVTLGQLPKRFRFPCAVNLLLTSDTMMRELNRNFRGVPRPTNVLSFPQYETSDLLKVKGKKEAVTIGDIAMGYQYVVDEAKKNNKILINHVIHLFVHGILHLFGYDHSFTVEAECMEGLERKIMAKLNLPDPYIPQPPAARKK